MGCSQPSLGLQRVPNTRYKYLESLRQEILYYSLPKPFQHAISITRQLGLRYLWIDSFCIIQNSPEDWMREASEMPNTYQNVYVTIAAAATDNSTGCIFVDRAWTASSNPCSLPIPIDGTHGTVHFDVPFDEAYKSEQINYPNTRGWCIQEPRLSHRLLKSDRLQAFYICLRHGLVENRELPEVVTREDRNTFLSDFQVQNVLNQTAVRHSIIKWYDLLQDYTKRQLTFPNDKLVAIAGVANVVGSCIKDEYYAGLWRRDLPSALLWSPYEEEVLPKRPHQASLPATYRAPSWSWASVDGPISCFVCWERAPQPPYATILEVGTTLRGTDVYGQVSAGYLGIRAPFKQAISGPPSDSWPNQPLLHLCGELPDDITQGVFDIGCLWIGTTVWCLQITAAYGLVLVKAENLEGAYRRVGVFHLRCRSKEDPQWFTAEDVREITIV